MEIDGGSSVKVPVQQTLVNPQLLLSCPVTEHQPKFAGVTPRGNLLKP